MVVHVCERCKKEFKKKSHYLDHINKKFICKEFNDNNNVIIIPPIIPPIIAENIIPIYNNNSCMYCGIIMSRKDHLIRHIENSCKVKKLQDEEKENIFKILLAKEEEMKKKEEEMKKKDEEIKKISDENKKQINELQAYIKNLSNMNFDLNNKVGKLLEKISVGNINNGVINQVNQVNQIIIGKDKLCNFGMEDISKIDTKLFSKVRGKLGKYIFRQCAENIFNNLPNNKTLYISDLSRERAMAYENGNWKLIPMDKAINTVNDQIRKYFKHNEKHYELLKDPKLKEAYDNEVKRHYKMYYYEYDDDDKYEPPQERIDEFNKVVADELKRFFYDIRENVKDNYENIKKSIMDSNILKKIEYVPTKKQRGRPKKNIFEGTEIVKNNVIKKTNKKDKIEETKKETKKTENKENKENKDKKNKKDKDIFKKQSKTDVEETKSIFEYSSDTDSDALIYIKKGVRIK